MKSFCNDIQTAFCNGFRIFSAPYKLRQLKFPKADKSIILIETPMYHELRYFFDCSELHGVSVLWATHGSGKTFTLSNISAAGALYWDCNLYPEFEHFFFAKVGLNHETDKELMFDLINALKYTAIVLDHFDACANTQFLLLVCDTHSCALELLHTLRPRAKLLGMPYCGRMQNDLEWDEGERAIGTYRVRRHGTIGFHAGQVAPVELVSTRA
jgi:hypothetical protein